ncbi:glycosyltransferase [Streptomyces sp. NPDC088910]|uniref:glycosyltransferase n=1 Tax=Streptomyces sp. NPDC088910 TaxID=3365911 RepID=UPI00381C33C7
MEDIALPTAPAAGSATGAVGDGTVTGNVFAGPGARTGPAPDDDVFVDLRSTFWTGRIRPAAAGAGAGALLNLTQAEYGWPLPEDIAWEADDLSLARLRRACRMGLAHSPETLTGHAGGSDRLRAAAAEAWPDALRVHGADSARDALREALRHRPAGAATAALLDVATARGLRPLEPEEAAELAAAGDRATRHAAWRYLAGVPGGASLLPVSAEAEDPYERLMLLPGQDPLLPAAARRPGLLVAQPMLLGGLDTPGEGLSGGLSVLLSGLGDALADTGAVAAVVTVVTACRSELARDDSLLHARGAGHWVLRLPVDAEHPLGQHEMGAHREALAWWAVRLLGGLGARLDVLHARYADDGSLAMAQAAERLGARLVFTATPDPHRQMTVRHGRAPAASDDLRDDLHRVFVADRLVERAARVVAIPGQQGDASELVRHFPQLAAARDGAGPAAPPEGIQPYVPAASEASDRADLLGMVLGGGGSGGARRAPLGPDALREPLLLCVGRLHPVKQQDMLVRAWLERGLYRRSSLVLIGGASDRPSAAETAMRARIGRLLARHPGAAHRLVLLTALSNTRVRRLERALADPASGARAWYVCPSAKEEFGIAVLEAMDAGLPTAAPERGGVRHYLRDGDNGVLLDTSSAPALGLGLERMLDMPPSAARALAARGRATVTSGYTLTSTAAALVEEYLATAPPGTPG